MRKKLPFHALCCALLLVPFLSVNAQSVVWNGSVNNSWSVPANWTPAVVPGATSTVTIAATANAPVISTDALAQSLTLNANAGLTIQSGSDLALSGALTVAPTATFVVESGANLLQSTAAINTGAITVNRNSAALMRLDYALWSSPVAGQNLLAFSPQTLINRFYTYGTLTNVYNAITPSANVFGLGQGYLIRMPNTHPTTPTPWTAAFNGVPNNGDYPVSLSNGGSGLAYNLVGNPYPSAIDMEAFVADNEDAITGTIYFWRETNGTTPNNAYCTWAGGTFTSNGQSQAVDPQGIIQTGQGFFVEAKAGQTALLFKNTQRSGNNTTAFLRNADIVERNTIWLNTTNAAGAFSQMAVGYISGATSGIDIFDGKQIANSALSLNSILSNTDYVIQGRPLPFEQTDVVPLSFKTATAGNHSIAIDHVIGLFSGEQPIYLKDNLTGTLHNLKTAPYTFSSVVGTFNSRFELRYQNALATTEVANATKAVTVHKQENALIISTTAQYMKNAKLYDVSGRLLAEKENIHTATASFDASFSKGVAVFLITLEDGTVVTKKFIN